MAPHTKTPVNRDPPATATPLPATPAASGTQIPSVIATSDAIGLITECIVKCKDTLLSTENHTHYILDFKSFEPPTFDGSSDDIEVAFDWLSDVEDILDLFNFSDEQRVKCAVFMLKEHARNWWTCVKPVKEGDGETRISWQQFRDMFSNRFIHDTAKFEKEMEFLNLKQGNMSVFEYEKQFSRLSRFAPDPVFTPAMMVHRFVMGLRKEIRGLVAVHRYEDISTASWAARMLDESMPVISEPTGHDHGSAGQKRKHQQIFRGP